MSVYSMLPIADRNARTHVTAVYVMESGKLALYCRKCARTLSGFGTVIDLRDLDEVAKKHRMDMRAL